MSLHVDQLTAACKHELLRVAELQADDYNNDRALYYACRDARERLCHNVHAGEGRVYKCLFRHKFEREMDKEVCVLIIRVAFYFFFSLLVVNPFLTSN
jgi:Golgi apparatus protein 1